jgi:hypothetical protein
MGDKLHRQEGNNPDRRLRPLSAGSVNERMWDGEDARDVGLKAAIVEGVRNSTPGESPCAENSRVLSPPPKPRDS